MNPLLLIITWSGNPPKENSPDRGLFARRGSGKKHPRLAVANVGSCQALDSVAYQRHPKSFDPKVDRVIAGAFEDRPDVFLECFPLLN